MEEFFVGIVVRKDFRDILLLANHSFKKEISSPDSSTVVSKKYIENHTSLFDSE